MDDQRSTMTRISRTLALLFALALPAVALDVPPAPTQWVTDRAGILDAASAESLNAKLRGFEERTGTQFIVYTLPSLEGDSLEDFTIRAAEAWRVGQKKYDNGLILFVFPQDRQVRIEVGYGLEGSVTDAISSRVIRNDLVPAFQAGNYAAGINAAADSLIGYIEKGEEPHPVRRPTGGAQGSGLPFWVFLLIPIFVIFVLGPLSSRGGCLGPACWLPFLMGGGTTFGGHHRGGFGGGFGGFSGGGGGFGGFSGGGGGFGGGGASGSW
jgi:uncharacterized protein